MSPELLLLGLLTTVLGVMSCSISQLKNRIRRLEREVGLNHLPPNELICPPEHDRARIPGRLAWRVDRIEDLVLPLETPR